MSWATKDKRRKNGAFYIAYVDRHGETQRDACAVATMKEAKALAAEKERREERIRLGLEVDVERMLFGDLCPAYLRMYATGKKSYAADKGRIENHLMPHFGTWFLDQIIAAEIRAFLNSDLKQKPRGTAEHVRRRDEKLRARGLEPKPAKPLSKASREQLRVLLQGMFTFAKELKKWSGENPAAAVGKIKGASKKAPQVLEPEEAQAIVACVRDEDRGLFALAACTGLRKGELLRLRPEDVNLEQQWVCVQAVDDDNTPKDEEPRYVPLPDWAIPFLRVELGRVRSEWLFPAKDGKMRDPASFDAAAVFRTAMKQAGIVIGYDHVCRRRGCTQPIERRADAARRPCPKCSMMSWPKPITKPYTFKTFRSTYGTIGWESTGDIRFAQNSLGHGDAKTTEHYAKRRRHHMLKQANQMPALVPQFTQPALSEDRLPPAPADNVTAISTTTAGGYDMRAEGIEPTTYGLRAHAPSFQSRAINSKQSDSLASITGDARQSSLAVVALSNRSHEPAQRALSGLPAEQKMLTAEQVASALELDRETVYRMARRGQLPAVHVGARVRFRAEDIDAFLARGGVR